MEKLNVLSALCALVFLVAMVDGARSPSPVPPMDCSDMLLDLANCLTFVENGSTISKPDDGCCSGLKTVLKEKATCLCDVFNNSSDYGISLNITKAMSLPSVCGLSSPSLSQCSGTGVPVAPPSHAPYQAPAPSPKSSHQAPLAPTPSVVANPPAVAAAPPVVAAPPVAATPPVEASGGVVAEVPAPALSKSGNRETASSILIFSVVIACFAVAMGSYF